MYEQANRDARCNCECKRPGRTKNEKKGAFCEIDPVELPVWGDVIPG